ncbi:uncharacterized protein LOC109841823 [Asparagus officinalis]|uniref:uncharacterized protein LOC109841823 n=1 Tax=Asparagus officinalis TaxID=4686 RepID=UPI00098E4BA8|nr:uncharacterized protein LOC109841823 [Asparagus officinalis]
MSSSSSTSLILVLLSLPSPTTTSTLPLPFKTPLLSLPSKPFSPLLSLSLKNKKQTQTLVPFVAQTSDWAQQEEENMAVADEEGEGEGIATAGSPIHWDDVGEKKLLGPELVQQAIDKIQLVRERLRTAQSRQKSYVDQRRRELEFQVGDHVFLKVSPTRGVKRFGIQGKLSPRFIGPFEILERIGPVAYRLALPPALSGVHDVFHISMLRKFIRDPNEIVELSPVELKPDLTYEERPERIVDFKEQVLRHRIIKYVKVQWNNHSEREATWETEDSMRERYPELFRDID